MTWVEVATADGPMRVFEAHEEGGHGEAAIVVQEAFGVNDYIAQVARDLAAEGFHSVAPDFFHRAGGGVVPYDGAWDAVVEKFSGLDDDKVLMDLDAAIGLLHDRGFDDRSIAVVGFCWGGRVSFLAAVRRALGAAVGFYGGGIVSGRFPQFPPLVGEAAALQTPWLGLFGDLDQSISVEDVETLRAALDAAPVDHAVHRYAEAGHGFHCQARPTHLHKPSAEDGWERMVAWFNGHLKPGR
jgi:carboxymethylenebutenolidase